MIFVADNFAFVHPGEIIGTGPGEVNPTNPGAARIPFGISGGKVFINGQVEINAGGTTLNDLASLGGIEITATSQYFKVDSTGAPVNSTVTLGISFASGLSGTVTWSAGAGYSGTPPTGTNTWVVSASDQTADAVSYTADINIGGTDYTDTITLVRLRDGTDTLTGVLTNEAHTIPTAADGSSPNYTGAAGTFQVYRGTTRLSSPAVSFSYVSSTGFSSAPSSSINATTGAYSISGDVNADVATVTYRATVGSTTIDKVFTLTRAKQGATGSAGTNAKILQGKVTSDIFSVAADGTVTPSSITISVNGQNLSGSPTFTVTAGTATLTGTGSTRTLTYANLTTDSATIQVAQDGLTDDVTIAKVRAGTNAITVVCPNQSHNLPADSGGTVSSYAGSGTTIQVYEGATALTYTSGTAAAGQYTITKSVATGTVTTGAISGSGTTTATVADHSSQTTDVATVLYSISGKRQDGTNFTASVTQTLTKSKQGPAGNNGAASTSYWLTSSAGALSKSPNGTLSPTTLTFSSYSKTGSDGPAAYAGRFVIAESTDGSTFGAAVYTSSSNESSKTHTPGANAKAIRCRMYQAGGTTVLLDETIVPVVQEGTDAITAVVANPNQTVPASNAGVVSSYSATGTTIQIYEGAGLLTFTTGAIGNSKYTCGTPTVNPSGKITVGARSGDGLTTLTVADHSGMANDTDRVTITYPILVQKANGTQVSMNLTQVITKSKGGARGVLKSGGYPWGIRAGLFKWEDNLANRVIHNLLNNVAVDAAGAADPLASTSHLSAGDEVTLANEPPWQDTRGEYSSSNDYVINEFVLRTVSGTTTIYRAIRASGPSNGGAQDPNSTTGYWTQVGVGTSVSAWASTTTYSQYACRSNSGTTYFARFRHTSGSTFAGDQAIASVAVTRYWNGAAWVEPGVRIDGNLHVTGWVSASNVFGGILQGVRIQIGTGSTPSGRAFEVNSAGVVWTDNLFGGVANFDNSAIGPTATPGVVAITGTGKDIPALQAFVASTNNFGTGSNAAHAVQAVNNKNTAAGIIGGSNGFDFYASGGGTNYGPFTGSHEALVNMADGPFVVGDIVVAKQMVAENGVSNTIWRVVPSTRPRQNALGVVCAEPREMGDGTPPAAFTEGFEEYVARPADFGKGTREVRAVRAKPRAGYAAARLKYRALAANGVGEGQINVCGEGGLVLMGGDLIVTSSHRGKGMKQADDIIRSSTIAKVYGDNDVVVATFSGPDDWQMVPCVYLSA